jgi:coatomer subunit beta'
MIKSFETGNNPVRCARFIVRKQWIVAGTDDMKMRVFNYNTMDKIKEWDAHNDYIRFIEVHPNRPFIFSCSDDMSIKLWDWEKDFECATVFEGHQHYVMMVKINPRDTNTFASASLDKSIKVWGITAGTAHFSLEAGGHDKGVNCLDYYPGGDKPYLLSGADDRTVKIWDYQTKACLQTLEGHSHNVSSVCFHPRLPLIISASEDGTVRLWHATTYRPETTLNYGLERAWCVAVCKESNKVALGYDEGTIVLKLGNERPVASLDTASAKLVWARGHDIQTASLKGLSKADDAVVVDGERIALNLRDLGACELYPQTVSHNSNGAFIVVCGDGEYIIYTSQALRNKSFGSALDFVWSAIGNGDYAIRESISRVRTFKNFKEHKQVSLPISSADGLFGGHCIAVKGADCVCFFDWEDAVFIRKIDVPAFALYWNETGDSLVIASTDCFYVLRFDREAVTNAIASDRVSSEEGVDGAFELVTTISEKVQSGQWVGECFLFTSDSSRKLCYVVGGEVMTLAHLNQSMYLLGFVPKEDRVFLVDKSYNVVSYTLRLSVLSYQTAVVRRDFVTANALLPLIPQSEYSAVARFLESQGFKEEALAVTTDSDQKFELAIELKRMEIAHNVLLEEDRVNGSSQQAMATAGTESTDSTDTQSKWRRLGDLALLNGQFSLFETCAKRSNDLSGLLLLYSSSGHRSGLIDLAKTARNMGRYNVAFVAYLLTGQLEDCIDLLVEAQRVPEACLFARTYLPSHVSKLLTSWKKEVALLNEKAAEALADPAKYANLFPDYDWALKVEEMFLKARENLMDANLYTSAKQDLDLDLIALVKERFSRMQLQQQSTQLQEQENDQNVEEDDEEEEELHDEEEELHDEVQPVIQAAPTNQTPSIKTEEELPPASPPAVSHGNSNVGSPVKSPETKVAMSTSTAAATTIASPISKPLTVSNTSPVATNTASKPVADEEEEDEDDEDADIERLLREEEKLFQSQKATTSTPTARVSASTSAATAVATNQQTNQEQDEEDVGFESGDDW